jgi:hypothetical protein
VHAPCVFKVPIDVKLLHKRSIDASFHTELSQSMQIKEDFLKKAKLRYIWDWGTRYLGQLIRASLLPGATTAQEIFSALPIGAGKFD